MSKIVFIISFLAIYLPCVGQHCSHMISGHVEDLHSGKGLETVTIYIKELGTGVVSDSLGYFEIRDLCHADYHLVLSHIGCASQQVFLHLEQDTILNLTLDHDSHVIEDIVVNAGGINAGLSKSKTISVQTISDNANENISNILGSITGVSTLRNGSNIAKPIVNGLYGNRVTILNNGIAQNGQQWGNDHSPEIDPQSANKLSVINGVSALAYPGSQLGAVVLIEAKRVGSDPHLHGQASYFFESNGRGHGTNLQLQQSSNWADWRITGTLKKSGDRSTPDYFLNNTGSSEQNASLQLRKKINNQWVSELYFSTFNSTLGVLRGSQISNPDNLAAAFTQEVPFYTEDDFSYNVESPSQRVNHNLLKLKAQYLISDTKWIDLVGSGQWNDRKEFDIRRAERSTIPALSLLQQSYYFSGSYNQEFNNNTAIKTGVQFNITDNTNNPETKVLPLIPDYISFETGVFATYNRSVGASFLELGVRYDNQQQNVVDITTTFPREIVRYNNNYSNGHIAGAISHRFSNQLKAKYDIAFAMRNPAINELYSGGLHQGVSGIELGDPNLESESSLKNTLSLLLNAGKFFSLESQVYYQAINDYIFLNPTGEFRSTIRGIFPIFQYQQTAATLFGIDMNATWNINESLHTTMNYSYLKGHDNSQDIPLIFMPANNLKSSVEYEFDNALKIGNKKLENTSLAVHGTYVFKQNNLLENQDFAPAPDAYFLLSAIAATDIQVGKTRMRLTAKVDNILNTVYRDYLNRLRYFADEQGINFVSTVKVTF